MSPLPSGSTKKSSTSRARPATTSEEAKEETARDPQTPPSPNPPPSTLHPQPNYSILHNVFPWNRTPPAHVGREGRRRRGRDEDDGRHAQQVGRRRSSSTRTKARRRTILTRQADQGLRRQVRAPRVPRGRAEQGRERVPGPVRGQVLLGALERLRPDAGRGGETAGRRLRVWPAAISAAKHGHADSNRRQSTLMT